MPELAFSAIFVRKGGALFEGRDETKEIGLGRIAFAEEMKMIGHEREGMEQEGSGALREKSDGPVSRAQRRYRRSVGSGCENKL